MLLKNSESAQEVRWPQADPTYNISLQPLFFLLPSSFLYALVLVHHPSPPPKVEAIDKSSTLYVNSFL